ncbi:unnamed protein product [Owenia fusiformis]|uniref:Uncharacterized protein n=1 Tax=Owenia fusiformis TaxID=6347 RepID=A0A8J1Y9X5_OWEFU|nr:unnamed protein product [Owenia fusiformis]
MKLREFSTFVFILIAQMGYATCFLQGIFGNLLSSKEELPICEENAKILGGQGMAGGFKLCRDPEPVNNDEVPNGKPSKICLDLVIALDVSCSVPDETKEKALNLIKEIVARIVSGAAKVHLVTYANIIQYSYPDTSPPSFYSGDTPDDFLAEIERSDFLKAGKCKTKIANGFSRAKQLFDDVTQDRNDSDYPDVLLMIGDGRGSEKDRRKGANIAGDLASMGCEIVWVVTPLEARRDPNKSDEVEETAANTDVIFRMNDYNDTYIIAQKLFTHFEQKYICE